MEFKNFKNRLAQHFAEISSYRLFETDVDKEASVSIMSLATDLNSVDITKYEENDAQQRPKVSFSNESKRAALHALCA